VGMGVCVSGCVCVCVCVCVYERESSVCICEGSVIWEPRLERKVQATIAWAGFLEAIAKHCRSAVNSFYTTVVEC